MDRETKGKTPLTLPMSRWLAQERAPDTVVAWRGELRITLAQLRRDVAGLYRELNAHREKRWALCFDDCYRFTVALLASLYCGKVPIIFGHQREAILQEQRADFDALLSDLPLMLGVPRLTVEEGAAGSAALPDWPDAASLVLYTSGSTGEPQKVHKPVAALDEECALLAARWLPQFQGRWIAASVSHQHLYGLSFRLFMPMACGVPFDAQLTEYHEQLIAKRQVGQLLFISSPAWLTRLDAALSPLDCALVFSAGGPLPFAEAQRAQHLLGTLPLEIYGATETGIIGWRQQHQPETAWRLFDGVTLQVDAQGLPQIDSPLLDAPLSLNDILQPAADTRYFHLQGRSDRIIKIEEKRLSLTEVERRLRALPAVSDAAVLPLRRKGRISLGAVIVLSAQGRAERQTLSEGLFTRRLHQALRPWLEPVALPRSWRIVTAIPRNPQGKRAYAELQELFL
ncbi:AMP-binding protein [Serratia sp. MYb239]|uniref:AMP-binding protein n=1 Tax=Serratia sp. MYb239 TaxID=2033438 RepID=UPI000CF74C85|nr:AMP-binding protein [Serratia sp. MYb239]AVJ16381.1 AMP-binding protein [Serratia sp. MYb239]